MLIKMKLLPLLLQGFFNTVFTKVDAGNIKTIGCQLHGMPSFSAGHIQHGTACSGFKISNQFIYKCSSFRSIPVKIKLMIVGRIKPIFKPRLLHSAKLIVDNQYPTWHQACNRRILAIRNRHTLCFIKFRTPNFVIFAIPKIDLNGINKKYIGYKRHHRRNYQ